MSTLDVRWIAHAGVGAFGPASMGTYASPLGASLVPASRSPATQVCAAEQASPLAQSALATHSTHWDRSRAQTSPWAEQSTSDRHGAPTGAHTCETHELPLAQSMSALHSTHTARVVLHTSPAHVRDEV